MAGLFSRARHVVRGPKQCLVNLFSPAVSFDPEDIAKMSAAFEAALRKLGLADGSDPATIVVAKLIIEFAKAGERNPERLSALACSNYQSDQRGARSLPQAPVAGQGVFPRTAPF
jgi:hypothetical protein